VSAPARAWLDGIPGPLRDTSCAALPGARASVLSRLWGALAREPIPGIAGRRTDGPDLVVTLHDGRQLRAAAAAAQPFAAAGAGFAVTEIGATDHTGHTDHDDPARLIAALDLPGASERLVAELDNSVANLALARAAQPAAGPPADDPLVRAEQSVVDGHPLHPCCRTRLGMSPAEVLAYAPEHRPVVDLDLVAVPADRWLSTGDGAPPVLPMHPWQWTRLRDAYPWLRHTGRTQEARPLMSLRTVAVAGAHLKTAIDVQMTSAVRTISPAAVRNGPVVSALLADLATRTGNLSILSETAAGTVVVDGEPVRSLAFVRRAAPRLDRDERAFPLAALTTTPTTTLATLDTTGIGAPEQFFTALVRLLLPPLLTLLHRGVALEAHGQNMLVVLRRGRPVRLLYRDTGGVRLSPRRLDGHGVACPPLSGDLESDDPAVLRSKLFAAVVSTVVGAAAAMLTREYGVPAGRLWDTVADTARRTYAELPADAAGDARALFADTLPIKAMTAMRLAAEPLDDIWAALPNPLAGLR
jgi:siderophore synthetase component